MTKRKVERCRRALGRRINDVSAWAKALAGAKEKEDREEFQRKLALARAEVDILRASVATT